MFRLCFTMKRRMLKAKMGAQPGFTIIELLVVMAIIGILTTITAVSLNGIGIIARDTERGDDVAAISRKLEQDYSEQTTGMPSYPGMNSFVQDITSQSGTAAGADPNMFQAPDASSASVQAATSTDAHEPNGSGSPGLNQYFYQALTSAGLLCKDSSQTCVHYRLFYRLERTSTVVILESRHQQ